MHEPSLSTVWLRGRFDHLAPFFQAAREMGFMRFELSHTVTSAMLDGISPDGQIITSIHDTCPMTVPWHVRSERNIQLAANDESARRQAAEFAKGTIDLAVHLHAQCVVLHMGQVEMDWQMEYALREMYRQGRHESSEYADLKARLIEARAKKQHANLESAIESLGELAAYARPRGVKLGVENRSYFFEIPDPDEMATLLEVWEPTVVFYWHDTGHAQALENLGFYQHEDWLKRFSQRMAGIHLHDIDGIHDHRIPGTGSIDFNMVASYIPDHALRVCEFDNSFTPEEVIAGVEHLRKAGRLGKAEGKKRRFLGL